MALKHGTARSDNPTMDQAGSGDGVEEAVGPRLTQWTNEHI
jgi:hypothetical protein